jgi:hypothetical protein
MKNINRPTLVLDFDGVLHSYTTPWAGAEVVSDPPVDGALVFLRNATEHFTVAIYSSRTHQPGGLTAMQEWLAKAFMDDLEFSRDEAVRFVMHVLRWPLEKPAAFVTLDDRAITFTGVWPKIEELLFFKPWNR